MLPQFIPAAERWQVILQRGGKQLGTFPVVGWAIFRGFAVEPMVFDFTVGRAITVKDLAFYNQDPATSQAATVRLERV